MIYITGDMHGDPARMHSLREYGENEWTKDDFLIVCGDFGFLFADDYQENAYLNDLQKKPYTICFVDGNHENFPAIFRYPTKTWRGGRIHRIRINVIHLMRGQVFDIDGSSFFTMGGGYSKDKYMRKDRVSYWSEEMPDNSEYREAEESLKERGFKVDYILTHTAPSDIIRQTGEHLQKEESELNGFFDWIAQNTEFKQWYFGHLHKDKQVNAKFRALYREVIKI